MEQQYHLPLYVKFQIFVAASVIWTVLFLMVNYSVTARNLKKRELDDIRNRIVSMLHGVFAFATASLHVTLDWPQYGTENTLHQEVILLISCSYFFYDMIACAYYNLATTGLLVHHCMTIMGEIVCFVSNYGATEAIYGLFIAEASNFPMHARMILKTLNLRYTLLYEILEVIYMVTYIAMRGVFAPIMCWNAVPKSRTPLLEKFAMCGLVLQSQYYIYEMLKILKRRAQQYLERRRLGVALEWLKETTEMDKLSYYQKESRRQKVF